VRRPPSRRTTMVGAAFAVRARIAYANRITCYRDFRGLAASSGYSRAQGSGAGRARGERGPLHLPTPCPRARRAARARHFHEVVAPSYPLFVSHPPYTLALFTKMGVIRQAHAHLDLSVTSTTTPAGSAISSAILARDMSTANGGRKSEGRDDAARQLDITNRRPGRSYSAIRQMGLEAEATP